jgi:NitT/TauT family transport system substrate-binding protein
MTDGRWAEFYKVASTLGMYPKGIDYKRAYTLRFVDHGVGVGKSP